MIPPPPMSLPRALVLAHRRGEVTTDDLFRGLMAHREWLVPLPCFSSAERRDAQKVSFGPRQHSPPGELWLFSEQGTAHHATTQGAVLGCFLLGVQGTRLFSKLPPDTRVVKINPSGYPEDLLELDAAEFERLQTWAETVALEQDLLRAGNPASDASLLARMHQHPTYYVPLLPDGRMLAKPGEGGFEQPGVVCTSPDSYEVFADALDPSLKSELACTVLTGAELTEEVSRQGVDAIFLNPFGPGPTAVWPRSIAEQIAAA
ncbi:MAG: hypothetical protein AAGE52_26005 [Myxococcota bacterium]